MREIAWIRLLSTSGERSLDVPRRLAQQAAEVALHFDVLPNLLVVLAICHLRCARRRSVDGELLRASWSLRAGHNGRRGTAHLSRSAAQPRQTRPGLRRSSLASRSRTATAENSMPSPRGCAAAVTSWT